MAQECHEQIYKIKIFLDWKVRKTCWYKYLKRVKKVDNITVTNSMTTGLCMTIKCVRHRLSDP